MSATVFVEGYPLTLTFDGDAIFWGGSVAVSVTSSSRAEVCTDSCVVLIPPGEEVTLEALVSDGVSYFNGFWGDCSEQGNPCVLTMDQDRLVGATFYIDSCAAFGWCG